MNSDKKSVVKSFLIIVLSMLSVIPLLFVLIISGIIIDQMIGENVSPELWRVITVSSIITFSISVSGFVVFRYFRKRFRPSWDNPSEFSFDRKGEITTDRSEKD